MAEPDDSGLDVDRCYVRDNVREPDRAGGRAQRPLQREADPPRSALGRALALGVATLGLAARAPRPRRPRPLLALGHDGLRLELDARRLDLGDDLLGIGEQRDVRRDLEIGTLITASKSTSLSIEYSIDCGRWSGSALIRTISRVEQRAALVHDRDGRAGRDERDVDRELLGHPDEEQIDMERPAVDRVDLDAVDEDRAGLLAVDRQVDQGVLADVAAEQVELVGVDGDALGLDAVAEDDGRQATVATEQRRPSCRSTSRGSAARVGRVDVAVAMGAGSSVMMGCVAAAARHADGCCSRRRGQRHLMHGATRTAPRAPSPARRPPSRRAQPALLLGDPGRLRPVPRPDLLDRRREVVADRALRQRQAAARCPAIVAALERRGEHLPLSVGERVRALGQGVDRERRVDDATAGSDPPDRRRRAGSPARPSGGTPSAGLHRPAEVARAARTS